MFQFSRLKIHKEKENNYTIFFIATVSTMKMLQIVHLNIYNVHLNNEE